MTMERTRHTILAVDDTPDNLVLLHEALKERYEVRVANGGDRALRLARADPAPDLILLDIMMPDMDGFEVLRRLRENADTRRIPVIFLTARSEETDEEAGIRAGAADYITKPFSVPILLARVENHLKLREFSRYLEDKNAWLEGEVLRRTEAVKAIQDVTIQALTALAETRDNTTGSHIIRTQRYVGLLAAQLAKNPRHAERMTPRYIDILTKSAPLHDIGKVGISDSILLKEGALTEEEYEIMKRHTTIGRDAILHAERRLGTRVDFLDCAKEIVCHHQERWDGTGYPDGLRGADIPLSARIMAVADVYDALISVRPYKAGRTHQEAAASIREERGTHFDPDVVDAFIAIEDQIRTVAETLADGY